MGYVKLDYTRRKKLLDHPESYPATPKLKDDYGQRYEQLMILYGETGNPANVVVGWIQKPDGSVSMTSVYIKEV